MAGSYNSTENPYAATHREKLLSDRLDDTQSKNIQSSVLKAVVEETAETYKVTRQPAAIRVSELGYPQAVELCDSETVVVDRRHRRSSTAAKIHQQPIDEVSAFRLYMSNEFLKATLDTGSSALLKDTLSYGMRNMFA